MKLPNFVSSSADSSSKIGYDFSNKLVQKLKLSINHFYKKCAPKQLLFNEKIRKIRTSGLVVFTTYIVEGLWGG
jgi:hypothetical protein